MGNWENWNGATMALSDGAIDFAEFAQQTQRERGRWVTGLRQQLRPIPPWHGQEDSEQDFLLECWVRTKTFDSERSTNVGGYYRFGIKTVGKAIQKARGVEQHRRTGAPQFERAISSLGLSAPPEKRDTSRQKDIEAHLLREQYYEILRALCQTPKQLAVVCALHACGGSLAATTAHLYADPELRFGLRLLSERHAKKLVERVVDELIEEYGKEEAQ